MNKNVVLDEFEMWLLYVGMFIIYELYLLYDGEELYLELYLGSEFLYLLFRFGV